MVRWQFFSGRAAAEAQAAFLRGAAMSADQQFLRLPLEEREKLVLAHKQAAANGVDVLALAMAPPATVTVPSIAEVLTEMLALKKKAGRAADYLKSLRQIGAMFARGRESLAVDKFTVREVELFLDGKALASRATLRARLATVFKFAVRRGYRLDNPCDRLEAVSVVATPPAIFTLKEVELCLAWLQKHPRSLAWFVLSTFAGLRPEEAEQTSWREINFKEGWIKVEAQTTKVRQRRVVYPLPLALGWLRRAKQLKSTLPLSLKQRTKDRKRLRAVLGWPKWKQDVTRHTAASMWLAYSGSAAAVALALGHSESILRKNYLALVTKAEAERFWRLRAAAD